MTRVVLLAACIAGAVVPHADAQMRDSSELPLTALDGRTFVVTSGSVRVPQLRDGTGEPFRIIDLADDRTTFTTPV